MKILLSFLLITSTIVGCSSSKKSSGYGNTLTPLLPPPEAASVTFMKNGKELAKLDIADIDSGVSLTFSHKKLGKGDYVLFLEDQCKAPTRAKNELPKKIERFDLGDFSLASGESLSEFSKPGISIADRFIVISEKSVSLNKKNKKGKPTRIACAPISKR